MESIFNASIFLIFKEPREKLLLKKNLTSNFQIKIKESFRFGCFEVTTFNPIPTGLGHVTLIYGLIPPMAGRNRVKYFGHLHRYGFMGGCVSQESSLKAADLKKFSIKISN